MLGSTGRVMAALNHRIPDRTPLFEIFQPFHPIHWPICGRNLGTDMALAWDAMADGVAWQELFDAQVRAQYRICTYFELDMVRLNGAPGPNYPRPTKTGPGTWTLNGIRYWLNPRTNLVEEQNPEERAGYSGRTTEEQVRRQIEAWEAAPPAPVPGRGRDSVTEAVRALAQADGTDWVYMGEIGAGTGVAFYPPFMLMWMLEAPELFERWLAMQKASGFAATRAQVASGCQVIAMGGDVSCDKGPFISPALYRRFILPVIQEHVRLIHELGAKAVYTSDGNHWLIRDAFFFESGIDGYKEVDKAAGMAWPRLISEGVADRVCIIGNLDARHTLCHGTPAEVRAEVRECLRHGRGARGGHILHASHSVHEDVKPANYLAAVAAYREFFGLPRLPSAG